MQKPTERHEKARVAELILYFTQRGRKQWSGAEFGDTERTIVHVRSGRQNNTFVERVPLFIAVAYKSLGVGYRITGAQVPSQ